MADAISGALERACERRFPAWTLYARAFSGNRAHAEYLVRVAVTDARKSPAPHSTEAEVHAHVLSAIRSFALQSMNMPGATPAGSVLDLFREPSELASAERDVANRLRELPRAYRLLIDRALLRRPSWTLEKLAACEGSSRAALTATFESGLRSVAAFVRRKSGRPGARTERPPEGERHPALEALLAYVQGALAADEARALVSHGTTCASCGDRLGTMMLLRAASAEALRLPRVPRGYRRAAWVLLPVLSLTVGFLLVRQLMPNPWEAHATRETVPRWFSDFLYRNRNPESASELARGLSLLVEGKYEEATETLEPWVQGGSQNAEASTYLGIARYLSGDSSRRTLRLLHAGTSSSRVGRLARWYLANVLLSRGDVDEAAKHLTALAGVRDWFGRAAKALLEKLDEAKKPLGTLAAR
jgi:hypothetical protein